MCFEFLYNFCLINFSFYVELSELWSKVCAGLHVKYPPFLSDFNETWIFSTVSKHTQIYKISLKSIHWEPSCCMRTKGRTDKYDEASSHFSQFCKMLLKNWNYFSFQILSVSARASPYLNVPQKIFIFVAKSSSWIWLRSMVEWHWQHKRNKPVKILSQCRFVHLEYHVVSFVIKTGSPQ